jgi:hypothetical protein
MPVVLPNEGLPTLLSYWLGRVSNSFAPWSLVLFSNNLTPDQATVYADMTLASFGGYSPVTLGPTTWTSPTIVSGKAVSTYDVTPQTWTVSSGSGTIYGAAIVTPTSPIIIAIERFAYPIALTVGGVLGYLPRITFGTDPSP